jgi:uncharacterized protein (TIGR03083 family)
MDPWIALEPDRRSFADYLETLTPDDWATQSWCHDWDVKGVAAHLLVPATQSKGKVFRSFVSSGFNLKKMNAKYVAELGQQSPAQIIASTRNSAGSRSAPPGLPPIGVFSELVVHSMDIAGALGKPFALPAEHYVMALDHMKNVQPALGCKKRIAGLTLQATDTAWSTGSGPLVEGPANYLLAAMTGRRQALPHLNGPGVEIMAAR